MSDYGIEQEIGQAVVKRACVVEVAGPRFGMCLGPEDTPSADECRACWHEWAKGVLKGEK